MQPGPPGDSAISLDLIVSRLARWSERTYPNYDEEVNEIWQAKLQHVL
jgi:hypothetical protein